MAILRHIVTSLLGAIALFVPGFTVAQIQTAPAFDKSRENLMVVVRESLGANKQDETLTPTGKAKAKLPDGREIEIEMASWEFIGDTHIRFVFDGPQTMMGATPQDLARLNLPTVSEALAVAMANVKRVYGNPKASPWTGGIIQVQGKSPDLDSTYFLDREFWRDLLQTYPEGVVVAVPKRGGLLYAPLKNKNAVESLKSGVAKLHTSSGRLRVSSALYLFKGDKWAVFQAAVKQ